MILHRHKLGPPILLGDILHLCKLERPHRTGADIPHLAALHEIVQRLHRLGHRHGRVEAMDLQQVDVVRV